MKQVESKNEGSSLARMLALLDVFTHARYEWTVEDLAEHFHFTVSSTYRYVKELCKAGLLIRLPKGIYVVGARVVELEALIRETDPVTNAGKPILEALATQTGCHTLLSNVYGDHLLNILHISGVEPLTITYVRGRSLPWFKGAPAKSVLAFWPKARVKKLFDRYYPDKKDKPLWEETWDELKQIRKQGYCISYGELDAHTVGYGVPVYLEGDVIGTISLVCSDSRAKFLNDDMIGATLVEKSTQIQELLEAQA